MRQGFTVTLPDAEKTFFRRIKQRAESGTFRNRSRLAGFSYKSRKKSRFELDNGGAAFTSDNPSDYPLGADLAAGYHFNGNAGDFTGNGNDGSGWGQGQISWIGDTPAATAVATYTTDPATDLQIPGSHTITAVYDGDGIYDPQSSAVTVQVEKPAAPLDLTSSADTAVIGQPVTFSIALPSDATGAPALTDTVGGITTTLPSPTAAGAGVFTWTTSNLAVGAHAITAVYTSGTNDPYVSNTSELDEEIDPDFALTGPAAAVPSSGDLTYAAAILADGTNSPTSTFDFSIVGQPQSFTNVNLSDAAQGKTFTGLSAGTYTVTVTYHGDANYHACTLTRTLVVADAPTIAALAPVTVSSATSATLSVPDPSSDPSVIYGWSVDSDPAGAADPAFSANLSHAASTTVATFSQAGVYKLRATVANAAGLAASTSFTVTVNATLTSIAVTPPPWILPSGDGQQQFTAAARDQFGDAMTGTSFNWSTSRGAFDGDVLCYNAAPGSGGIVTAGAGGVSGSTSFWIEDVSAISASGAAAVNANMPYMLNLGSAGLYCNPITSWTIDWGDGSAPETISTSPLPAAVPHVYTSQPASAIEVTAFSPAVEGHPATTYSTTANGGTPVSVEISTPALPLSGDGIATLGEDYTLTLGDGQTDLGSGADVSYNIFWGDGSQTTVTADDLAAANDQVTHVFTAYSGGIDVGLEVDGIGYYNVGLKNLSFDATSASTTTLSLGNVSPDFVYGETLVATVAAAASGTPGGTVEFYDGTIDLGTGTLDQNGMATLSTWPLALGEHDFTAVYGGDGTFYGSTSAPLSVSMSYPCGAGNLALSGDSSVAEGGTYILHLPATTPGNTAIYQWSIDWGDGTATAFRDHPSSTTHVYGVPGTFTIAASAVDSGGTVYAAARSGGEVTVCAVGPSIFPLTVDHASYCGADTLDGGALLDNALHCQFTGPAAAESYSVTIDWGDGSVQNPDVTTFALAPGETSFDYSLPQYARTGAYGIKVTVTDEDGHAATNAAPIYVHYSNMPPSGLTASFDEATVYSGSAVTLSGSFADPQWDLAHTVTIHWGDASDDATFDLAPGQTTFDAPPHTYPAPGPYTRTITISGADGTVKKTDTVAVTAPPADVTLVASVPSASEGSQSPGEFTFTRDGDASAPLTVYFTLSGGTVDTDYTLSATGGTYGTDGSNMWVTFDASSSSVTIEVTPIDTGTFGGSLPVCATLVSNPGYIADSNYSSATLTISYDDLPTVGIAASVDTAYESGTPGQFTVSRNGPTDDPLMVSYTIDSSNAVDGGDYQLLCGDVLIAAGDSSATIAITPIDTGRWDDSGSITLTLAPADGVYNVSPGQGWATVTLDYDDPSPMDPAITGGTNTENVSTTTPRIHNVNGATGVFTVTLTQIPQGTATVELALAGTAQYGTDYTLVGGSSYCWVDPNTDIAYVQLIGTTRSAVAILPSGNAGAAGKTIIAIPEGGLDVFGASGTVSTPIAAGSARATVTIADDPPQVSVSNAVAIEGDNETFTVTLSHAMSQAVDVSYHTSNGTALSGSDYVAQQSGVVEFAANTSSLTRTITVSTKYNAANTRGRDFSLVLSPGPTYLIAVGVGDGRINVLPAGKLTIYYGDGSTIPDDKKNSNSADGGGALLFTGLESNVERMDISAQLPAGATGNFYLVNHSSKIAIYTDASCQNPINYNQPAPSVVYVKATGVASGAIAAEKVDLVYRVSGLADNTRDTAAFTAVSVQLNNAEFTSEVKDPNGLKINIVRHATSYDDSGLQVTGPDVVWADNNSLQATTEHPFAQKIGTTLTASASVTVSPGDIQFSMSTVEDSMYKGPSTDSPLSLRSVTNATSSGNNQSETLTLAGSNPLPEYISSQSPLILWEANMPGWKTNADIGTSTNTVFVTYDKPITTWANSTAAPNYTTDFRLDYATSVCSASTGVFQAARAAQLALGASDRWGGFPSDAAHDTAAEYWKILDPGGNLGKCAQYAQLEQLILGEVGIGCAPELILPTLPGSVPNGTMRLFTAGSKLNPNAPPNRTPGIFTQYLVFDFRGQPNYFEGGIRIIDPTNSSNAEFFCEGHTQDEYVVAADNARGTAEYNAIVQMALNFAKYIGRNDSSHFQRWTFNPDDPKAWLSPADYKPLPESR